MSERRSHWKVWTDAAQLPGAQRVLGRVVRALGVDAVDAIVEPYHKGGHVARFDVIHEHAPWSDLVFEVLLMAQSLGGGWTIYGSLEDDPSGWLTTKAGGHVRVSGVECARWMLLREGLEASAETADRSIALLEEHDDPV